MKSDDSQADNLFSRLLSYTPRIGEQRKRTALEDYYTEALAWCLRSKDFRKDFFDLVRNAASELNNIDFILNDGDDIEIDTQLGFTPADDDDKDEENGGLPKRRRRFDLVIHSTDFVIVLEDKVKWRFTENQIPDYQRELENGRFSNIKSKFIILLSPSGRKFNEGNQSSIPVIPMRWSEVQKTLEEFSGIKHSHHSEELSAVQSICMQFANFLKDKGLVPMKISKANNETVSHWISGFETRDTLERILNGIQAEVGKQKLKKPAKYETNDDGSWLGLYDRSGAFYVGFRFTRKDHLQEFSMFIQLPTPKKEDPACEEKLVALVKLGGKQQKENLNFEQKVSNTEFDGNADKIRGWFEEKLSEIFNFL